MPKERICSLEEALKHSSELKEEPEKAMDFKSAEDKVKVFKALADEIRLRIFNILQSHEMCVCEILVAIQITQPTAAYSFTSFGDFREGRFD